MVYDQGLGEGAHALLWIRPWPRDLTVLLEYINCCIRVSDCSIRVSQSYFHEA